MIGKHLRKRAAVLRFEKRFHGSCGKLGKSGVRGRKDSEGPLARERIGKAGGLDGCNECRVIFRSGGGLDNGAGVLLSVRVMRCMSARNGRDGGEGRRRKHAGSGEGDKLR